MDQDEYQREFNSRITSAIEKLTETVADLEKHTVLVQGLAATVADHETRLRPLENSMDFVSGAKHVFVALIIALIVGSGATIWQVATGGDRLTKKEVIELMSALKHPVVSGLAAAEKPSSPEPSERPHVAPLVP